MDSAHGTSARLREDALTGATVLAVVILLGAPAGLIWSWLAPHLTLTVSSGGADAPDLESTKAFVGADGSYLLVGLLFGVACGLLAWRFARRSGPWTVVALAVGGTLAALVAAEVGLRPGSQHALAALGDHSRFRGTLQLYLGRYQHGHLGLRMPWAFVFWPVGACVTFLVAGLRRPHELD